MIIFDFYELFIFKFMYYVKNVCGINVYWNRVKDDLKVIII